MFGFQVRFVIAVLFSFRFLSLSVLKRDFSFMTPKNLIREVREIQKTAV